MIFAAPTAEARPFTGLMDYVAQGFEALGAAILVLGVIWSVVLAAMAARRSKSSARAYLVASQAFGGTLLLGLDITHRGQRPGPGTDRGNQDIPEFLAGNRDQGRCAMAAGDDERRGDHPSGRGKRSGFRDAALTPFTLSVRGRLAGQLFGEVARLRQRPRVVERAARQRLRRGLGNTQTICYRENEASLLLGQVAP